MDTTQVAQSHESAHGNCHKVAANDEFAGVIMIMTESPNCIKAWIFQNPVAFPTFNTKTDEVSVTASAKTIHAKYHIGLKPGNHKYRTGVNAMITQRNFMTLSLLIYLSTATVAYTKPSSADFLLLSEDSYTTWTENPSKYAPPTGFIKVDEFTNSRSGALFSLYRSKTGNQYIFAFAGTNSLRDAYEDSKLLLEDKKYHRQFNDAKSFIEEWLITINDRGGSIYFTGHSLGGAVAQYAAMEYGWPAVTFNAAPIPKIYHTSLIVVSPDVTNFRIDTDPISDSNIVYSTDNYSVGNNITLESDGICSGGVSCHSLSNFFGIVPGTYKPLQLPTLPSSGAGSLLEGSSAPVIPALSGTPNQPFEFVSYYAEVPDLTDDLQAEIIENAPRHEPPPFPGQSPLYDNAHGFLAGGFGLNYNQTFSRDMLPVVENGVTKFRFSENNGNGSYVLVPLNERTSVDFSYLSWGTDRAVAEVGSRATLPFIDQVFWLYGEQTPSTVLESRTGTADFSGNVYGHYYRWPSGGASTVDYDAVTGTLTFSADFTDDTITGDGEFNIAASGENFSETFALLGTLSDDNVSFVREFSGSEGGLQYYVGSAANIVTELTGTTGSGHMTGSFYGPDGLEAGGNISYFFGDRESAIAGVFVAQHGDAPEPFGNVTAFMTSSDYSGNIWDNGGDMDRRPTNNSVPYEEIHLPSIIGGGTVTASSVHTRDGYSYMSWGMWSANDSTPVSRENGGYWVAGEQTPESVVQGRTGSANYSGEINGDHVSGGIRREMGGTIELTADFNSDVITGEMQMHSSVASTPNFEISAPINGSGFAQMSDGSTNGYGAGFGINGAFLGPNADEIAGTVWSGGGPTDSWNGIFFADQ